MKRLSLERLAPARVAMQWYDEIRAIVDEARAALSIADVEVLAPSTPYATTVGTPGVSVYLLQLGDLAVFPQT